MFRKNSDCVAARHDIRPYRKNGRRAGGDTSNVFDSVSRRMVCGEAIELTVTALQNSR